ncbi:MAG: hypothetical protein VX127_03395 [Myxococcota bacterium]|nr:hypothetical protein [Myxococcota bacterium]
MKQILLDAMDSDTLSMDAVRALFAWQVQRIDAVGGLARARGIDPAAIDHWLEVPPVFTAAFKRYALFGGDEPVAEFRTSGTSGQGFGRSLFSADGLDLMAAAVRRNADRMLFPDRVATRVMVLAPPPDAAPHLIMAWGMARLVAEFGTPDSGFCVGPDGLDVAAVLHTLERSVEPVTLIGASFGFVHLLDAMDDAGRRVALPKGSRIMDAGGFKGRSRVVDRGELMASFTRLLGVPASHQVNVLGMTELASQFYDNALSNPTGPRVKVNPPWTATAALDPHTLEPVPDGEVGVLRHLDLANIDRPFVVQTDDLGRCVDGGFEVLGRAVNANDRGCSITVDALIRGEG